MFRVLTKISFFQTPTESFPDRKGSIIYNFCHDWSFASTWKDLTSEGELTLPKNVNVTDQHGQRISLGGTNVPIGGFNGVPVFLRGDRIKIESGYAYFNKKGDEIFQLVTIIDGWISMVTSKKPFVLKFEDNMYKLKQAPAHGGNNNFFSSKIYTVEKMLQELIKNAGLPFTVNTTTSTVLGDFPIQNETIAQVLGRLKKDYHFQAYFRGNELRCGSFIYLPDDVSYPIPRFKFQCQATDNAIPIIDDELEYQRKDDIVLSAVAKNVVEEKTGEVTKDGYAKTKRRRLEVLVTFQNGSDKPFVFIASPNRKIPANDGGERRTLFFPGAKTPDELAALAANELKKYYYTGMSGKFTTFGLPHIKHGDYIDLLDPVLPERNGRYVVKGVEYSGGVNGIRQVIELDYLIGRLDAKGNFIGL